MSEFKGTEGNWKVIDGKSSGKQVISESAPKTRMNVASCGGQRRDENANLISAAPDLIEALQDMLSGWKYIRAQHGDLYGVGWERSEQKAIAAIAKALGETNE